MKKNIRMLAILFGAMSSLFFEIGFAHAANFDISGTPTEGVTIVDSNNVSHYYTRDDIARNAPVVLKYINENGAAFTKLFFNANTDTQNTILNAYNQATKAINPNSIDLTLQDAQIRLSTAFLTGLNGDIIYKDEDIIVTKGTFIISGIVGIVNDDGNYRLSNGTRENLTRTPGISKYRILPPEGTGAWIDIKPPTPAAPTNATCVQNGSTWSISANWTSTLMGVQNFKVRYLSNNSRDVITGSGARSYTFSGVTSSGTYNVVLAVSLGNTYSNFSPAKSVTCNANTITNPVVNSFTANPPSIFPGSSSTLSWASNGDSCIITKDNTDSVTVPASGTMIVSPTSTTRYDIVCSKGNLNSTPRSVTINVGTIIPPPFIPAVTTFITSSPSIIAGQSSTLSWTSNTNSCIINADGISRSGNGSMTVSPVVSTQYAIICSKDTVFSEPKYVTINVVSSGEGATNPYSSTLSTSTKTIITNWISKNITSRSTMLLKANYVKFLERIISRLEQIKATTPASNTNKLNVINYLVWELQQILNDLIFDGLFS